MQERDTEKQWVDVVQMWSQLTGKPYTPSWHTDIRQTFYRVAKWKPTERKA